MQDPCISDEGEGAAPCSPGPHGHGHGHTMPCHATALLLAVGADPTELGSFSFPGDASSPLFSLQLPFRLPPSLPAGPSSLLQLPQDSGEGVGLLGENCEVLFVKAPG